MQVIHFPDDPPPRWNQPVLALGNFDGLHRGHMKIIDRVRRRAGERGGTPAAMTFAPHPPRVVRPDKAPPLLMTEEQKIEALARSGMQGLAVVRFTTEVSHWEPETFVADGAGRSGCTSPRSGSARTSCSATTARATSRCCAAWAPATASAPRRSIPSATRTSSSAAPGCAGWCQRGAGRRGRRAARPSLLHRRRGRARRRPRPRARVSDREPADRERAAAAVRRLCHDGDDRRHRPCVGDQHRDAADVRRRRRVR